MAKLDLKIFPYALKETDIDSNKKNSFLPNKKIPKGLSYLQGLLQLSKNDLSTNKKAHRSNLYPLTLVSSAFGKIERLVFHYENISDPITNNPNLSQIIGNLLVEMSDVDFYIVVNKLSNDLDAPEYAIKEYFQGKIEEGKASGKKENRIHFIEIKNKNFTIWASDTYKAAYDNNLDYSLIEPHLLMDRVNTPDANIFFEEIQLDKIDFISDFALKSVGLSFAGGNILVGDDFILMGRNIESFNSTGGTDEKELKKIIPLLIDYMVTEKIDLFGATMNMRALFENDDSFLEQMEKVIKLNKNNDPFSKTWANVLKKSASFKKNVKTILEQEYVVEELFERLLGGGAKKRAVHFLGEKIKDSNRLLLNSINHSAIRKDLHGSEQNQPLYHIDLFITLAGGRHLVIGEPVIGLPDETLAYLDSKTLGMISHQVYRMKHYINKVIKELESEFTISRIPLPLTYYNYLDKNQKLKFAWYWATYNNALVEIDKGSKKVWIPSFYNNKYNVLDEVGFPEKWNSVWNSYYENKDRENIETPKYASWSELKKHQEKVEEVWKGLGFEAIFIQGDFNWYAQYAGSLGCLTNCIKRTI